MIKKLLNSQSYFRKMLTMCLLVISVTIFILTFFFYHRYTDALSRKLYDGQERDLEKSGQTMNDLTSEIFQLYNTVILDAQVVKFNSMKEFDPAENYATYLIVKKFYNINPYVDSLYIYNDMAGDSITCGSYRFDLAYCWDYLREAKRASVFPSPLAGTEEKVLTFAYPVYGDNYDEISGGVFISLDMEKITSHVLGTGARSGVVLDRDGNVLMADYEETIIPDPEVRDRLLAWARKMDAVSASCLENFYGKQYLCAFYKDVVHDYLFFSSVPYSEIVGPMRVQRNLALGVALLIFLAAVFFQYVVARRLYRPLEIITKEMRDSKYAGKAQMDEIALIRHVYEKAIDEISQLEEQNAFYQPRLKADLLRGLLLGNRDVGQTEELLGKNGWDIPFEGMFIICFFIECSRAGDVLGPVTQTKIGQYLHKKLDALFYTECVPIASDQVVCMINTKQEVPITFEELVTLLEAARKELSKEGDLTVTICLDGVTKGSGDFSHIYRSVLELKNYRFVLGYNQIIYPGRIMELMPECLTYPDKLADEILSDMVHGRKEAFEENVEEFIHILSQYAYQPAQLLYNRLYLELLFQTQKSRASEKPFRTPETLEEGACILSEVFTRYQNWKAAAEKLKDNKHFERIEESRRYIEEHYQDFNLSAGMVAEYLGYSTNYFSRIFKSITGFYINDYIRQIRIMKAQELLVESDMTITSIAEASGFSTANYFYAIFKKETGLTPAAYRNAGKQENIL